MDSKINGELGAYAEGEFGQIGLTKRELLAAMAMQGWLSSFGDDTIANPNAVAEFSVKCADALLKALEK